MQEAHTPSILSLILCLDPRLHGDGYPQYILTKAAKLNNCDETMDSETKCYTLYDKILNYWFPPTEGYDICPQWTIPGCERTDDFSITFVIEYHQHPLLLIEINPSSEFLSDSGRCLAISQVIDHLDEIGPTNLYAERLYAIAAIGKSWRAYYTSKGKSIEGGGPVKGVAIKNSLRSAHPKCWNPDITSNHSWVALQSIVETIKGYVG
jgi:hypothetical protein